MLLRAGSLSGKNVTDAEESLSSGSLLQNMLLLSYELPSQN